MRDKETILIFTGDVMLGRAVGKLMDQKGDQYSFVNVQNLLFSADAVVANLEGPILSTTKSLPPGSMQFAFASNTPMLLLKNNISIVSLANNHTGNFGNEGYLETTNFLDAAHVAWAGMPYSIGTSSLLRKTIGDQKFIFISFNFTDPHFDVAQAVNFVKQSNKQPDEFTVLLVHGGTEYAPHSTAAQRVFYRKLIEAGADVVVGNHPHVVEEVEIYKNRPIFYSLGNFIFDQYFSKAVQTGLVVKLTVDPHKARYNLTPITSSSSQPQIMSETEASVWLKKFSTTSEIILNR